MGTGKFFPGGGKRNKAKESAERKPEPIRAEELGKSKSSGLFPGARERFSRTLDPKARPSAIAISILFCVIFISIGWYYLAVVPARIRVAQYAAQLEQRNREIDELKKKETVALHQAEATKLAITRATLKVETSPVQAQAVIAGITKRTPAVFEGLKPGKEILTITLDGYRPFTRNVELEGNQVLDLGLVELVAKAGTLQLTCATEGATYSVTGPNGYSKNGVFPATLDKLPPGTYTISAVHKGWQLPPVAVAVEDGKETAQEAKFGYGTITIQTTPPGASVRQGHTAVGQTPLTLKWHRPGHYDFIIEKDGYLLSRSSVDLKEFGSVPVTATLEKTKGFTAVSGIVLVWLPDRNYWVGKYEVTQKQYEQVMGAGSNPSAFRGPNRPVEMVTWQQAVDFCGRLTESERAAGTLPPGYIYSLPTEAQWSDFAADASLDSTVMALNAIPPSSTADVGTLEPNQYGLYDVIGNVWEWCLDNFDTEGRAHVMRGGGWLSTRESFPNKNVRNGGAPTYRDKFTGFRVVLIPKNG